MSEEEIEAIEYLKNHIIPYYGSKGKIEFLLNDIILNIINKQIEEIEELKKHKEHEQEYQNGEVFSAKQMYYIEENYIDKDKIREKIKELENLHKNQYIHLDYTKKILEELLKEK